MPNQHRLLITLLPAILKTNNDCYSISALGIYVQHTRLKIVIVLYFIYIEYDNVLIHPVQIFQCYTHNITPIIIYRYNIILCLYETVSMRKTYSSQTYLLLNVRHYIVSHKAYHTWPLDRHHRGGQTLFLFFARTLVRII